MRRCAAIRRERPAVRHVDRVWAALCGLLLSALSCARVQADGKTPPLRVEGFAPDAQLVGGVGFGLGGKLDNYFLGRARLGALYAHEPWMANAGLTIEVGALGGFGVGCELELSGWSGLFADVGLARVDDHAWMSHLSLGYTVLGLEWQSRFDGAKPSQALLFEVRLPLGTWWFLVGSKTADRTVASVRKAQAPLPVPQPTAADASDTLPELQVAPVPPAAPSAADRDEAAQLLAEAQRDTQSADYASAASALERAYDRIREPQILLQLADAQVAQGKLRSAAGCLRRFLDAPIETVAQPEAEQARTRAQVELDAVQHRIAHLRLELSGAHGDETVELDGTVEPSAALGYDVALDPGDHNLVVRRAGVSLVARDFHASDSELVRFALQVP